jgi:hypothetical protein
MMYNETKTLLEPVENEIWRQDEKWGPDRTHADEWWYAILGEEFGELGKALLEKHFHYEGARADYIKAELVQVVAVGIQWLNSIQLIEDGKEVEK